MAERSTASDIDTYISEFSGETKKRLQRMRTLIHAAAPQATETISYAMPTFDLNGKHLVHFAGYAHHIGLYPTPSGTEEFKEELSRYKTGKGSVQLPHDQPLPEELITRIVEFRLRKVAEKHGK